MTSFQVNIIIYAGRCKILVFFCFAVLKGIKIMITIILFCRMRVGSRPHFYRRSRENCVREVKEGSKEEDVSSVKVCLELVNLLANMEMVRKDATQSALRYLFTNSKNNDHHDGNIAGLKRKFNAFNAIDMNENVARGKLSKISTRVVNKSLSKVDKTITVETTVDSYDELDDFTTTDTGVVAFDSEIMFN